jgi:eukaryotic-like serine/threonine-protein kinase
MKEGTILQDRYALVRRVGRGGTAVTWLADDRRTDGKVVVKLLSLGQLEEWKALELFEREAAVLRGMRHEGIPAYVDCFQTGAGARSRFVLVQEYVEGRTLQEMVDSGWRGTEDEIRGIGVKLLRVVEYIHALRPPVIHRDVNPRNVIVRADGAVFLVDFGGVQDAVRVSAEAGATVIGTPGYMPMEQFVGRATVRSDLYGFAATLAFLLTHKNPQDLPVKDMKIDVAAAVDLSPGLARVLSSWLEPDEARRVLSVDDAIECLEGRSVETPPAPGAAPALSRGDLLRKAFKEAVAQRGGREEEAEDAEEADDPAAVPDLTPPSFSRIRVQKEDQAVTFTIPGRGGKGGRGMMGGFLAVWLGFVGFWTFATAAMGAWPMTLFSIPFWLIGIVLLGATLKATGRTVLRLGDGELTVERPFIRRRPVTVPVGEVGRVRSVTTGTFNAQPVTALQIEAGARTFTFGQNLSTVEKRWVRCNVNALLRDRGGLRG